jgi:hypothetical protein
LSGNFLASVSLVVPLVCGEVSHSREVES